MVSTLWAKNSELDVLERIALSLGLSIAIIALTLLGLNYTPWGITLHSILGILFPFILIFVGFAWYRRLQLNPKERFHLNTNYVSNYLNGGSLTDKLVVIIIVIALVIGGILLIYVAMNPPKEKYSELYLLDENGETRNYPTNISVDESVSIKIVTVSHEQGKTDYQIIVRLIKDGGIIKTQSEYNFTIDNDNEWIQNFDFSINESGKYKLEIELFKGNDSTAYVTNHIWVDVRD